MNSIPKRTKVISGVFQIVAVAVLLPAGIMKFMNMPESHFIFESLEMGDFGRILIGIIELSACGLMLTTALPHYGALLALGTMLGAVIAHISALGFSVQGDGGLLVLLLCVESCACVAILFIHRSRLPLIGMVFDESKHPQSP